MKKKKVQFNANELLTKLDRLSIKKSSLSNPQSMFYIGCSNAVLNQAFRTGEIDPTFLKKIDDIIEYVGDPSNELPTISNFVAMKNEIEDLQSYLHNFKLQKDEQISELTALVEQVSNDLTTYSTSFQRASHFLSYSIAPYKAS